MSSSNCCFPTCIQVSQEAGNVVWYFHLLQNFPQFTMIHTVKEFGVVSKAEIDVFLELSCFFNDPADVGSLISGSSAFSKTSLNIWKFMVQILLKAGLENFESCFTRVWDECNCAVVWAFFGITLTLSSTLTPTSLLHPYTDLKKYIQCHWPHLSWQDGCLSCTCAGDSPTWSGKVKQEAREKVK